MDQLMDDSFRQQIATFEHRLSHLLRDGYDLQRTLSVDSSAPDLDVMRAWQRECAATISQLSGGSKQHWLSRAYSEAFLLKVPDARRPTAGEAGVGTIVERIIGVLRQAQASLAEMRQSGIPNTDAPPARRFAFVHDPNLRPRLEQAFMDAQAAFDRGAYDLAVVTWASTLEASSPTRSNTTSRRTEEQAEWIAWFRIGPSTPNRRGGAGAADLAGLRPAAGGRTPVSRVARRRWGTARRGSGDRAGCEGDGPGAAAHHAGFGTGEIDDEGQASKARNFYSFVNFVSSAFSWRTFSTPSNP